MRAKERDEEARRLWREEAGAWDASRLVFLDECGVHTAMYRAYARSPRGERAFDVVPRNRGTNTTVLGALSSQGVQAVMTLEGATDREAFEAFEAFIEQVLLPTLQEGQIVILDNLSAHKSETAQQLVEAKGCAWVFLPSYSPDFNPIEQMWSKFKSDLRRQAPRTQEHLDDLIWPLLSTVTPQHAHNWFAHAGFDLMHLH